MKMEDMLIDLEVVVHDLDTAIDAAKADALRTNPILDPHTMKYKDGKYIILDALTAKANALAALVNVQIYVNN